MKGIFLLFSYMTRLPMPKIEEDNDTLGKSMKFFPLVGIVIGLILSAFYYVPFKIYLKVGMFFPAIFITMIEVMLTGGLHLDGLANTFDGVFRYRSKQKMLDKMRAATIGANGVIALAFYFILKITLLYYIFERFSLSQTIFILLTFPIIGRLACVINSYAGESAEVSETIRFFVLHTKLQDYLISNLLSLIYITVLSYFYFRQYILWVIISAIIVEILSVIFVKLMQRKIRGITGDTLGAVLILTEVIYLLMVYFFYCIFI